MIILFLGGEMTVFGVAFGVTKPPCFLSGLFFDFMSFLVF
jgi:hypothetical protein